MIWIMDCIGGFLLMVKSSEAWQGGIADAAEMETCARRDARILRQNGNWDLYTGLVPVGHVS
jgi:hypothetical protein